MSSSVRAVSTSALEIVALAICLPEEPVFLLLAVASKEFIAYLKPQLLPYVEGV
jgi:hypothetical protein